MKSNREILDELGEKIVYNCFDGLIKQMISIRNHTNPPIIFQEKADFLKSLDDYQFENFKKILRSNFEVSFYEFFKIFEECQEYKIIYEAHGVQMNLNEISEMLKAEILIDNGWMERFSREI